MSLCLGTVNGEIVDLEELPPHERVRLADMELAGRHLNRAHAFEEAVAAGKSEDEADAIADQAYRLGRVCYIPPPRDISNDPWAGQPAAHVAAAIAYAEVADTRLAMAAVRAARVLDGLVHRVGWPRSGDVLDKLVDAMGYAQSIDNRRGQLVLAGRLREACAEIDLATADILDRHNARKDYAAAWPLDAADDALFIRAMHALDLDPDRPDPDLPDCPDALTSIGEQIYGAIDVVPPHSPRPASTDEVDMVLYQLRQTVGAGLNDQKFVARACGHPDVAEWLGWAREEVRAGTDPAALSEMFADLRQRTIEHFDRLDAEQMRAHGGARVDGSLLRCLGLAERLSRPRDAYRKLAAAKRDGWSIAAVNHIRDDLEYWSSADQAEQQQVQAEKDAERKDKAKESAPKTAAQKAFDDIAESIVSIDRWRLDLLTEGEAKPREFILKPYFLNGVVSILYGAGGVGKSLLALELGLIVAQLAIREQTPGNMLFSAGPLGGNVPASAAGAVLFVTGEDDTEELKRRLKSLDPNNERKNAPFYAFPLVELPKIEPELVTKNRFQLGTTQWLSALNLIIPKIKKESGHPVKLLILDPAGDLIGGDENDAEIGKYLMRQLRLMAKKHSMAILLLGHVGKGDEEEVVKGGMRGSSALVAGSRGALGIWRAKKSDSDNALKWLNRKSGEVFGVQMVKSNHPEAPRGRLFFVREADGRLTEARPDTVRADDHIDNFIAAVIEAAEAGRPFAVTGDNGLRARRDELRAPHNMASGPTLKSLADKSIALGLLRKDGPAGGAIRLVAADADEDDAEEQ